MDTPRAPRQGTGRQFTDYMDAFRAATEHTGTCPTCQDDRPCETGTALRADFTAQHEAWQAHTS